jgi:hypothetical protein
MKAEDVYPEAEIRLIREEMEKLRLRLVELHDEILPSWEGGGDECPICGEMMDFNSFDIDSGLVFQGSSCANNHCFTDIYTFEMRTLWEESKS